MSIDQKDVITNLLGAAGGTAGFGLALVAAVVALHGLKANPDKARINRWMKAAVVAFVLALVSVGLGFAWLVLGSWIPGATVVLAVLYIAAVILFLIAIAILTYVLVRVIWVLRNADLVAIASEAAATLKRFLASP